MNPRVGYLLAAGAIFVVEVVIAAGVLGHGVIRGSVGDILAVMLVYAGFRAILPLPMAQTALAATAVGFVVEGLQACNAATRIGLAKGSVGYTVLGNTASGGDLAMYVVGGILAYGVDRLVRRP